MKLTVELPDELVTALAAALAPHLARSGPGAAEVVTSRSCARYGLGRSKFRQLCASGEIRASKVGNRFTATACDVEAWLARQRVEPRPEPVPDPVCDEADPVLAALSRGRLRVVRGNVSRET